MQIDLVAEHRHYYDHLLPIWNALPQRVKGVDWGVADKTHPIERTKFILTAGYSDVIRYPRSPVIYVEHGAGQSYIGMPHTVAPFYSPLVPTKQHRNVVLFLCPNNEVADRWKNVYHSVPAVVVGSPKLDPWHAGIRGQGENRTVAVTFHWEPLYDVTSVVPELISAFGHYFSALRECVPAWRADGWNVIGHYHPRALNVAQFWQSEDVELVHESAEVLDRATVLIADNTSVSAEAMSLGRGVVWLNHPAYRRDVEHGGRFWQWPEKSGVQLDTPASLVALDLDAVPASTWHPYAYADGHAAERAAGAILSL